MEVLEGDDDVNVRSIDFSASVVNGFGDGCNVDQEVGPFCDAIPDLDESSVEDGNARVWREDNSEPEAETEAPVLVEDSGVTESTLPRSTAVEGAQRTRKAPERVTCRS